MNKFNPKINKRLFRKNILSKNQNEGNNSFVINTIDKELNNSNKIHFFEKFVDICEKYNIEFIVNNSFGKCEVIIINNGYESYKFVYSDKEKDITEELSNILYSELFTQILNKQFEDNVKKSINK